MLSLLYSFFLIDILGNDDIYEDPNDYDDLYSNRLQSEIRKNSIKERVPSRKAPGPPNDPAPPFQPRFRPSIKIPSNHQQPNMEMLKKTIANQNILRRQKSQNEYQVHVYIYLCSLVVCTRNVSWLFTSTLAFNDDAHYLYVYVN